MALRGRTDDMAFAGATGRTLAPPHLTHTPWREHKNNMVAGNKA